MKTLLRVTIFAGMLSLLGGCSSVVVPKVDWNMFGQKYEPLTIDVAAMAAPAVPVSANVLYCKAGRGAAPFTPKAWADFAETLFVLKNGERANIPIRRESGGQQFFSIQGYFDGAGQKLIFCPVVKADPGDEIACASIYALEDDLKMGIKRTFDIPAAVRGGMISCAFDRANLKPLDPEVPPKPAKKKKTRK